MQTIQQAAQCKLRLSYGIQSQPVHENLLHLLQEACWIAPEGTLQTLSFCQEQLN